MKRTLLLLYVLFAVFSFTYSQNSLPSVNLKNLKGEQINTSSISNDGKPIVVSFWATWCKPCILELMTINDEYQDWQEETGVKLYAISIDDSRTMNKVAPFVNGKGWEYEVLLDSNGDFKRAMNVNNVPHTFLLNGNGEIVHQHNSFAPGDEQELYNKIVELTEKK